MKTAGWLENIIDYKKEYNTNEEMAENLSVRHMTINAAHCYMEQAHR